MTALTAEGGVGMIKEHKRYDVGDWVSKSVESWWANVFVGGNYNAAEMACREMCFPKGLCVTIEKTKYIFGGGTEDGVRVGLIQYPPFPESIEDLIHKAISVGKKIAEENHQFSFTIVTARENVFFSRKK
jgi:hypothetical protein